jgi:protein farnesyltransferase/geranylgeranyltransferase type-1 subunit alpha
LLELRKDLHRELDYMDTFADDNPKNYQIWHHRRALSEAMGDGRRELAFTAKVFDADAKNYHAWTHRYELHPQNGIYSQTYTYYTNYADVRAFKSTSCTRQWVLQRFGSAEDWDAEMALIETLLEVRAVFFIL